jgi:hypothetical protein
MEVVIHEHISMSVARRAFMYKIFQLNRTLFRVLMPYRSKSIKNQASATARVAESVITEQPNSSLRVSLRNERKTNDQNLADLD